MTTKLSSILQEGSLPDDIHTYLELLPDPLEVVTMEDELGEHSD